MSEPVGYCIIPAHILADENLSANEKIIFGRINGLTEKEGYCFASNEFLAAHLGLSKGTVSNIISTLVDKGYIDREVERDANKRVIKRKLYTYTRTSGEVSTEQWGGIHQTMDRGINGSMEGSNTNQESTKEKRSSSSDFDLKETMEQGYTNLLADEGQMSYLQDLAKQKGVDIDELLPTIKSRIVSNPDKYTSLFQSKPPKTAASKVLHSFLSRTTKQTKERIRIDI